jgi:hypothetical protein
MIIQHTYNSIDYILSNENLKKGDRVYPISRGRTAGNTHIHYEYDFRDFMSGFPKEPHIIEDLKHSENCKPYEIRTDHGYGPAEMYYRIVASMNKSDYIVDRRPRPNIKDIKSCSEMYLFVMDKVSRSTQIVIGPKTVKINFTMQSFLTPWEIHCLQLFRDEPEKPQKGPIKFHKEYELVDVLKRYDDQKENTAS